MRQEILPLQYRPTSKIPSNFHYLGELTFYDVEGEPAGFDIETNDSLDPFDPHSEVICLAISGYSQVYHLHKNKFKQCLNLVKQIVESPNCMLIGHNLPFDLKFMAVKYGWEIRCLAYDTQLANYFLNEEEKFVKLKTLCNRYGILENHKEKIEGMSMVSLPYEDLTVYNGNDARSCSILKRDVFDPLLAEQGLTKIMGVACEAIPVLVKMMARGVMIDQVYAKQQQMKLFDKMIHLRKELKDLANSTFNPDSPMQLAHILYGKFEFQAIKQGKMHASTDYESIIRIRQEQCHGRGDNEIRFIDTLIEYNKLDTLNNNYYKKLPNHIRSDGAIHTTYNLGATDTGRLTSSGGWNMQQQKRGAEFRGAYIPRKGYAFLEGDWAAVEMRFLAHFAQEHNMIEMFKHCLDVHTATMCQLKGWEYDKALKIYKNAAHPDHLSVKNLRVGVKNFNFGEVYGAGIDKLQNELVKHGIYWTREQCEDIYYEKKKLFPNIVQWKKSIANFIRKYQFVRMPFGQLRRLPDDSWDSILKGINFIIQSTASGWFPIIGMILVDHYFDDEKIDGQVLLNVHDSILCEVKIYSDSKMERIKKDFERIMTHDILEYIETVFNFKLSVPLEFEAEYMERWR
jgi:DNA polymerase-1